VPLPAAGINAKVAKRGLRKSFSYQRRIIAWRAGTDNRSALFLFMHRDPLPARRHFTRLAGSADALAVARLAEQSKPLAVVSASALDAQRLLEEIGWFAPQLRACLLPDW